MGILEAINVAGQAVKPIASAAQSFAPAVVDTVKDDIKDIATTARMTNRNLNAAMAQVHKMAGVKDTTDPTKRSMVDNAKSFGNTAFTIGTSAVPGVATAKAGIAGGKAAMKVGVGATKVASGGVQTAKGSTKIAAAVLNPKNYRRKEVATAVLKKNSNKVVNAPTGLTKSPKPIKSDTLLTHTTKKKIVNEKAKAAIRETERGAVQMNRGAAIIRSAKPDIQQSIKASKLAAKTSPPVTVPNLIEAEHKKKKRR